MSLPSSLTKHIKWVLPSCGIFSYYILWNACKRHLLAGGTRHICQEADIIPNSAKTCKHLLNKITAKHIGREWDHMCKINHILFITVFHSRKQKPNVPEQKEWLSDLHHVWQPKNTKKYHTQYKTCVLYCPCYNSHSVQNMFTLYT